MPLLPAKIISGAQTGVDRAALEAALESGIPCGGYVPKGRRAEDGRVPEKYPMRESESPDYEVRTELNVIHSDATLILNRGRLGGGTQLTLELCRRHKKPVRVVALDRLGQEEAQEAVREFLREAGPRVLNVAGPRESGRPGIYAEALNLLRRVFAAA